MQQQKMAMSQRQFRIGDLAKELKVKKFVIRFWEKEFGIQSDRSQGGQRFYSEQDLKTFLIIKDLLYAQGFTIAGAKKQLPTLLKSDIQRPSASVEAASPEAQTMVEQAAACAEHEAEAEDTEQAMVEEPVVEEQAAALTEPPAVEEVVQAVAMVAVQTEEVAVEQAPALVEEPVTEEVVQAATLVEQPVIEEVGQAVAVEKTTVMGATNAAVVEQEAEEVALDEVADEDEMVQPATKEPCACAHINDQLQSIKTQLLALKALVERSL